MSYLVANPEDRFSCDKAHIQLDYVDFGLLYFLRDSFNKVSAYQSNEKSCNILYKCLEKT